MTTETSTPRRHLVLLAASAALVFAACGDDDEPSSDSPSETSEQGSETTEAPSGDTEPGTATEPPTEETDVPSGDTEPPTDETDPAASGTEDTWRTEMNALCDDARAASQEIAEPETVGGLEGALGEFANIGDDLFERAQELDTPESLQGDFEKFEGLWEEKREQLDGLPEKFDEAGYSDDEPLADISDEEAQEVGGDALDNSELTRQAQKLEITCFNNE